MSDSTPEQASSGQSSSQTPNNGSTSSPAQQKQGGVGATEAPMRCADARPYLSAFADGELAEPLRTLVATHVAGCDECRQIVQRAQEVDRLLASLTRTTPSPEVYERIQAAVARRGLDPVVRESLRPARWAQEIGGVSARAVKRLLTPRVVYPQEPEREDAEARPDSVTAIPARRRASWAVGALPAVAALLLIALSLTLFSGLARGSIHLPIAERTPTPPSSQGEGIRQAEAALTPYLSELTFRPTLPSYLPQGAQYNSIYAPQDAPKSISTLEIIWVFAAASGLQQVTLRETSAGQGFYNCLSASPAFGSGDWLQWGLPNHSIWDPLVCDGRSDAPAVGQADAAMNIALTVTPRSPGAAESAVVQLRFTSLSMDAGSTYQDQVSFQRALGSAHSQPGGAGVYLHYDATVASSIGQSWAITGETNTPYAPSTGQRREHITVVGNGANITDIVNGQQAYRLDNNAKSYQGLVYPLQDPTNVGRDGEPSSYVASYFFDLASLMSVGEVWKLPTTVSLNNRQMVQLVVVDAPVPTTIYVDAKTYAITRVSVGSGSGPGGSGAPTRLVASMTTCPDTTTISSGSSGNSTSATCTIIYSALWMTTTPDSANDFTLAPAAALSVRTLAFHLKQSNKECQTL